MMPFPPRCRGVEAILGDLVLLVHWDQAQPTLSVEQVAAFQLQVKQAAAKLTSLKVHRRYRRESLQAGSLPIQCMFFLHISLSPDSCQHGFHPLQDAVGERKDLEPEARDGHHRKEERVPCDVIFLLQVVLFLFPRSMFLFFVGNWGCISASAASPFWLNRG